LFLAHIPTLIQKAFPQLLWHVPEQQKRVYLTFDDGPTPEVTDWVLAQLEEYRAKATFFCIGRNVVMQPDIYRKVQEKGHVIGNHSYTHVNGWNTEDELYYTDVERCAEVVHSRLFRPPYGRISLSQIAMLKQQYRIVMWDVLSGDFEPSLSKEQCLKNVMSNVKLGSIIVFHDSVKAFPNLEYTLPRILQALSEQGYTFGTLT
jgi:peptidoglycan/xylan/chitin deacetylase (PgdA/CDA1 family)